MPISSRTLDRIVKRLHPYRENLLIALLCISLITLLDLFYSSLLNSNYVFQPIALLRPNFWFTCLIIFLLTFLPRPLFWLIFLVIPIFSIFQLVNFEYFGSYILPIHFIQLLPDFFLIMSELVDVIEEMAIILIVGSLLLVLCGAVFSRLSRTRSVAPRSAILVAALLVGDFVGNFAYISYNREKLGEPAFASLFPSRNNLAIHNFYKSSRFLLVGILPDRLAGNGTDYPSLPRPARLSFPDANIILIINESVRAANLSVLGYERETTPRLAEMEGLYASTIYAAGTMTRTSFTAILNRMKYPGLGEQFVSQSNCLFRLAKESGFKTHFFYAQGRNAANTLLPYMCANQIDSVLVDTDAPDEFHDYDESLAYLLKGIDLTENNFVVIGLNGAHSPYASKSPSSFKLFDDEYDNAIHYSDHVIGELLEIVKSRSTKPTYILVTSDHGELLKGEGDKRGHGWFRGNVVKVPFFFSMNNAPTGASILPEVKKVQSHFDMATLIVGLLGYDVRVEEPADKEIYINGSDLLGLAGQLRLRFSGTKLVEVEPINTVEPDLKVEDFLIDE